MVVMTHYDRREQTFHFLDPHSLVIEEKKIRTRLLFTTSLIFVSRFIPSELELLIDDSRS